MPKSKEYVSSSESSGSESDTDKKSKKRKEKKPAKEEKQPAKKQKKETEDDPVSSWELGNNRYIKITNFKGTTYVDIREMYLDKDSQEKPGRKGICLSIAQWKKLKAAVEEVDEALNNK